LVETNNLTKGFGELTAVDSATSCYSSLRRRPSVERKDFVDKAEITIRFFVYMKLLKLEEEDRAKSESQ